MKKALLILGMVSAILALMVAFASVASADNGPHGNFGARDTTSTTDSCAGCHRAHTGVGNNSFLRFGSSEYEFCTTCHGPAGAGANTNVVDGVVQTPGTGTLTVSDQIDTYISASAQAGDPLNGGGFLHMKMYVNDDPVQKLKDSATVTSRHGVIGAPDTGLGGRFGEVLEGTLATAWGSLGPGPGVAGQLDCTSCHDPHGSPNYRILKPGYSSGVARAASAWGNPSAKWAATYIDTPGLEPIVGSNEIAPGAHNYAGLLDVNYDIGISDFCGGCHSVYLINRRNFTKDSSTYGNFAYDAGDMLGLATRSRHSVSSKGFFATSAYTSGSATYQAGQWVTEWGPYLWSASQPGLRRTDGNKIGGSLHDPDYALLASGATNYNGSRGTCLTCHYAHGSAAKADGWASNAAIPDVVNGTTGDSANLYLDNRGVCQSCHKKGTN